MSESEDATQRMLPKSSSRNPLQYFRSIVILGDLNSTIPTALDANRLGNWIERFDVFQRQKLGFDQGNNLFLAVGRTISFCGDAVLSAKVEQLALCELGRKLGYATSVRIAVSDALADPHAYRDLVAQESAFATVLLDAGQRTSVDPSEAVNRLVLRAIEAGKSLSLIGSIPYWLDSGVLDLQELNGTSFSMSGVSEQKARADIVALVDPCSSRFSIFISNTGEIFPCQGLVGIPAGSIGHISAPLNNIFPGADWPQLDEWARNGPTPSGRSSEPSISALPPVCRNHREELSTHLTAT